ncbi:MAG: hypothetical protein IJX14_03660 [Clostridia bacterium]|nr:hypothetical protein [Clostridia bacterium]
MKQMCVLLASLLTLSLIMTACGGTEEDTAAETELPPETRTEETAAQTETEPETEAETQKEMSSFTDYQKLTVVEGKAGYDAGLGAFVVEFSDDRVRYLANDPCAIGISGGGEAFSMAGTIDMEAHPEFENGDYYTGIVVKPSEDVYEGTYNITITFDMYMLTFSCTIG